VVNISLHAVIGPLKDKLCVQESSLSRDSTAIDLEAFFNPTHQTFIILMG
jgi:hypothetical protein